MTSARSLPPLNALRAFEAAARHGNFTRAAEELSVAQPAVTRHINNLETWIGTALFQRRGNRLSLTPAGQELAELATSVLDRLELGLRNVVTTSEAELRIGASFGVTHLWLMPRIGEMRKAAQTAINFLTSDMYRDFEDASVDCSVRFGDGQFGRNASDLLFPQVCQIIASPAFLDRHPGFDPFRLGDTIDPEHLFDHGDPHHHGWMTWKGFAAETGQPLAADTPFRKVASYPTMLDMICAGEGVGIGYWGLEDALVRDGSLMRIGPKLAQPGKGYFLVYRSGVERKKPFARLRQHLLAERDAPIT